LFVKANGKPFGDDSGAWTRFLYTIFGVTEGAGVIDLRKYLVVGSPTYQPNVFKY
jgi:hypothetical protein